MPFDDDPLSGSVAPDDETQRVGAIQSRSFYRGVVAHGAPARGAKVK
jgi:hypothetical protein